MTRLPSWARRGEAPRTPGSARSSPESETSSRFPAPLRWSDLLLIGILTLAAGLGSLAWPFGRDQGNYAYAAWRWLEGELPYRDVYVFKPPLTTVLHALSQALFGHSTASIRALDLPLQAFTAAGVAWLAASVTRRRAAGLTAAALFLFSYYGEGHWTTAQTDGWFNAFAVAALVFAVGAQTARTPRRRALHWLAAGCFVGLAILLKYTAAILFLPLLVVVAPQLRRAPRQVVGHLGLAGIGTALTLVVCAAAMALGGFWEAFWHSQRTMVGGYVEHAGLSWPLMWERVTGHLAARPLLLPGMALLLLPLVQRGDRRVRDVKLQPLAMGLAWLAAGAISMWVQRRGFSYHMLPLLPGLAVAAAVAMHLLLQRLVGRGHWPAAAVLVAVVWAGGADTGGYARVWQVARGERSLESAQTRGHFADLPVSSQWEMARWLREHTAPEDPIFVWGYDPAIQFLAERRQVGRYPYHFPMVVAWQDGRDRAALMKALQERPPRIFSVASGESFAHVTHTADDSTAALATFPELQHFLSENYEQAATLTNHRVFTRRSPSAIRGDAAVPRERTIEP